MSDEHSWFREHLADHLLEILGPADAHRLASHADGCADCSALLLRARRELPRAWEGAEHVPIELLVRVHEAPERLGPSLLEAAKSHLRSCASCSRDLAEIAGGAAPPPIAVEAPPVERRGRQRFAWGAVAGSAAVAAAFLIVAVLRTPTSEPGNGPATTPQVAGREGSDRTSLSRAPQPIEILSQLRGEPRTTRLTVAAGQPIVALSLPQLFLSDTTIVRVELADSTGTRLALVALSAVDATRPGSLVLDTRSIPGGRCSILLRWRDGPILEERRYPIEIERSPVSDR